MFPYKTNSFSFQTKHDYITCIKDFLEVIDTTHDTYNKSNVLIELFELMDETIEIWYDREYLGSKFKDTVIKRFDFLSRDKNKNRNIPRQFFTIVDTHLIKVGKRCPVHTKVKGVRRGHYCRNMPVEYGKCRFHYDEYVFNSKTKQEMIFNMKLYTPPVITDMISEFCE